MKLKLCKWVRWKIESIWQKIELGWMVTICPPGSGGSTEGGDFPLNPKKIDR